MTRKLWDKSWPGASNGPQITERNYAVALCIAYDALAGKNSISIQTAEATICSIARYCPYETTRAAAVPKARYIQERAG